MSNLLEIIKQAAKDVNEEGKPVTMIYGTVESAAPLQIRVDQKNLLEEEDLMLSTLVQDHYVDMTVEHITESAIVPLTAAETAHTHSVIGTSDGASDGITHKHSIDAAPAAEGAAPGASETGEASPDHTHAISITTVSGGFASSGGSHTHGYIGRKTFLVHYGLQVGECVTLIRIQGGQKFIVLDRIR